MDRAEASTGCRRQARSLLLRDVVVVGPLDHPEVALGHVERLKGPSVGVLGCLEEQLGTGPDGVSQPPADSRGRSLAQRRSPSRHERPGSGCLGVGLPSWIGPSEPPSVCLYFGRSCLCPPSHSLALPKISSRVGTSWLRSRPGGASVDDLDGLEEGSGVPGQDALPNGVLNVSPVRISDKNSLTARVARFGVPLAAATGLRPALPKLAFGVLWSEAVMTHLRLLPLVLPVQSRSVTKRASHLIAAAIRR